ncbi:T9SS type A sorting domain-containing protein [Lewinella sp. 4G2]|uniref:T9SS type A sorting domain-containing protein n=1 Tax=Lewinella sp. 4G2 TaxID=1803372 RepID=UPI0009EF5DF2|nr:T9SS type A sorting domain-containing protein [Lewinella sp. 4G2]
MNNLSLRLIGALVCLALNSLHAQSNYEWPDTLNVLVPFYFEDGIGNKDTVFVGFSDEATDAINSHLGEVDITGQPFDSIFEVRVAELNRRYSPKFGLRYSGKTGYFNRVYDFRSSTIPCINYSFTRIIEFVVNVDHYPIKVSWDSSVFREGGDLYCIANSLITNNYAEPILDRWWEFAAPNDLDFKCLAVQNSTHSFEPFASRFVNSPFDPTGAFIVLPEEGSSGPDTMAILSLSLYYGNVQSPPCHDILAPVSNPTEELPFTVYPNPATSNLRVTLPENSLATNFRFDIYSAYGRLLQSGQLEVGGSIEVADLATGTYCLRLVDEATGETGVVMWVKR